MVLMVSKGAKMVLLHAAAKADATLSFNPTIQAELLAPPLLLDSINAVSCC
jgi:hypothetical protein